MKAFRMKQCVITFFLLVAILSGCSLKRPPREMPVKKDPSIETHVDQSGGLSDYIIGEAKFEIKSVTSIREDGIRDQVTVDGKNFDLSIPASITDKNLKFKVIFKNGKRANFEIELPKREPIDSYDTFADQMNETINDMDENVETRFPSTFEDGTFIADDKNDAQTWVHIQEGKLLGLSMIAGEEAATPELAAITVSFILNYEVDNDKVFAAFNDLFETGEASTVTSNGYQFTFDIYDYNLYIDIIKSVD
ncbi:hypothetical protein [Candidatus Enterococcus ferrettii]|uniref:Lipoprotein n=1 Tax=Candidatus Enterococcus ferrettii TaxID=2815324 RepID=A0ABV0EPP6_9ENTE|nr:hypothetical protein [Enterococcus sp. 665A]MBO1342568.1 hypothetical protein [Enterococcus sp. 665A]